MAGKQMTKAQIISTLADKTKMSKKDIVTVMNAQMELAYKEAKNGYVIPGIGKLVIVNRKARKGRNPATGETIQIPAKRVLKFRVAKAAKDTISLKYCQRLRTAVFSGVGGMGVPPAPDAFFCTQTRRMVQ